LKESLMALVVLLSLISVAVAGPADDAYDQAKSLREKGDLQEAVKVAVTALAAEPEHFKLNGLAGDLYFDLAQYQEALGFYQKALEKKKKDAESLFGAGMSAYRIGNYEQALEFFDRGIETGKKKGEFLYGLGLTQMEMGNYAEADLNLRKAIDKDKKNASYHLALGEVNYRNSVFSIAIMEFIKAVEIDSTLDRTIEDLHYKMAKAYIQMRNVEKAITEYRRDLDLHPADTTAWLELARICQLSDKHSEAAFCYDKYLHIVPGNGEIWFELGKIYHLRLRNDQKAAESFEKAVSLGSHEAESYGFLATIYADGKEYEKSIDAYNRYEAAFGPPDSTLYWFEKGKVQIKLGTRNTPYFDSALVSFQKATRIDSTFSAAYEYAGLSMYYKRDYAGAVPFLREKIELDSTSVNAYRNLAFCYLKLESYNDAALSFERALSLKPEDTMMRSMLGKVYTFTENYSKSIFHFEYLLNDLGGDLTDSLKCVIYPDLGLSYLKLLRCGEATPILLKAEKCNPREISILFNIASSYQTCNMMKEANTYYRKVLEIDPGNADARKGEMQTRFQGQQ
jgi:tetratricopeptide (TPR) repeat protein